MSEASNQMMGLLHELSILKELDRESVSSPSDPARLAERESLRQRTEEITAEMHRIAASKKQGLGEMPGR
jgi:hypothetical protein